MNHPAWLLHRQKNAHKKVNAKKEFFWRKFQPFSLRTHTKFFSLYIFWSHQHLATPTLPPCHHTSSFGHPTHPPLWWCNTWMVPKWVKPSSSFSLPLHFRNHSKFQTFQENLIFGLIFWRSLHNPIMFLYLKLSSSAFFRVLQKCKKFHMSKSAKILGRFWLCG